MSNACYLCSNSKILDKNPWKLFEGLCLKGKSREVSLNMHGTAGSFYVMYVRLVCANDDEKEKDNNNWIVLVGGIIGVVLYRKRKYAGYHRPLCSCRLEINKNIWKQF